MIDWISSISVDEETDELAEVTGQLDRLTGVAVLAYSLRIAAAILFILVIKRLTARQEAAVAEAALLGPAGPGRGVRVAGGDRRPGTGVVGCPGVPHRWVAILVEQGARGASRRPERRVEARPDRPSRPSLLGRRPVDRPCLGARQSVRQPDVATPVAGLADPGA